MEDLGFMTWLAFRLAAIGLLYLFLAGAIVELLLDATLGLHRLVHALRPGARHLPKHHDLLAQPERPAAVLMVVGPGTTDHVAQVEQFLKTTRYERLTLFVGAPGPPQDAADALRRRWPDGSPVVTVVTPPVERGAQLNALCDAVLQHEMQHGAQFDFVVLADPRCIMHPLALKYFNALIDDTEMIQLPLLAEAAARRCAATLFRADELAVRYGRDVPARARLAGALPSAGTGTAFSRQALQRLMDGSDGTPFDQDLALPEYAAGLRLGATRGRKLVLLAETTPDFPDGLALCRPVGRLRQQVICLGRYPGSLGKYLRSKARFFRAAAAAQSALPTPGRILERAFRVRDRASFLFRLALLPAYTVLAYGLATAVLGWRRSDLAVPSLIDAGEFHALALALLLLLLLWRAAVRFRLVARWYGPAEACLSLLRYPAGHALDFAATVMSCFGPHASDRAGELERRASFAAESPPTREPPPPPAPVPRDRLGELLVAGGLVSSQQLDDAVRQQSQSGQRIGEILVKTGALQEEDLVHALAQQHSEKAIEIDPYATPMSVLGLMPRSLAERYRVFPVGTAGETVLLATDIYENDGRADELAALLGRPVQFRWTSSLDIGFAIEKAYGRAEEEKLNLSERLGTRLVRQGVIQEKDLRRALRVQKRTKQRLGEVLVDLELISQDRLQEFLK